MHTFIQDTQKTIEHLKSVYATIRSGRANTMILDSVQVEAYGSYMPLNQLSTITIADASMLIVKPFDRSTIKDVEKAIKDANLGINPIIDGDIIRLPIPSLTEETRRKYVKLAHDEAENSKISVRQARTDAKQKLEKSQKDKHITEDQLEVEEKKLQTEVDKVNKMIDEMCKEKEESLMKV